MYYSLQEVKNQTCTIKIKLKNISKNISRRINLELENTYLLKTSIKNI